jgi:hypothetical protein
MCSISECKEGQKNSGQGTSGQVCSDGPRQALTGQQEDGNAGEHEMSGIEMYGRLAHNHDRRHQQNGDQVKPCTTVTSPQKYCNGTCRKDKKSNDYEQRRGREGNPEFEQQETAQADCIPDEFALFRPSTTAEGHAFLCDSE